MISEECNGCDYFVEPYGCIEHDCPIYKDWEECRNEIMEDKEDD